MTAPAATPATSPAGSRVEESTKHFQAARYAGDRSFDRLVVGSGRRHEVGGFFQFLQGGFECVGEFVDVVGDLRCGDEAEID